VGGFEAPIAQECSGPQCAVGVASGVIGIPAGIVAMLAGFALRARRSAPPPPLTSGPSTAYWAGGEGAGLR